MNSDRMLKIVSFLDKKSLQDINKFLSVNEKIIFSNIEEVEKFAYNHGVNISVNKDYTFGSCLNDLTGINGIEPHYKNEFEEYTCKQSHLSHLFYKVRDTITDFYHYDNADIDQNKKTVKMSSIRTNGYPEDGIEIIKEYKNGYTVYKLTGELLARIEAVKWINAYFKL